MMSRIDLERIDRTMRFLMSNDKPFGGKVVILSGDFRQILPVEPKPIDAINTCLKKSYLWTEGTIQQKSLTINERVRQFGGHASYSTFLMYVGLGLLKTKKKRLMRKFVEYSDEFTRIPTKIADTEIVKQFEGVDDFVQHLFPNLGTSNAIPESVVLTPLNKNMNVINSMCLERFKPNVEPRSLKSIDRPFIPEQEGFIPEELLNEYNPGGLPPHDLQVKDGCHLMLLRNVNLYDGLANGTRLRLKEVSATGKVMKVEILTGPRAAKNKDGEYIFKKEDREFPLFMIPNTNENDRVFSMVRKQFPVRLTYGMSINKAQGQTLKRVGLYLPEPVFSHGQLYVALSRVSRPESIVIYVDDKSEKHGFINDRLYTKNYVYSQLLREEISKFKSDHTYMGEYPNFDGVEESEDEDYYRPPNPRHAHYGPDHECPFDYEPDERYERDEQPPSDLDIEYEPQERDLFSADEEPPQQCLMDFEPPPRESFISHEEPSQHYCMDCEPPPMESFFADEEPPHQHQISEEPPHLEELLEEPPAQHVIIKFFLQKQFYIKT